MLKSFLKRKKQKGFTLIELIAVMTILGLLALLIIPRFTNVSDSAKVKIFENNARTLASQVSLYAANNNGKFPTGGTRTRSGAPVSGTGSAISETATEKGLSTMEEGLPTDYADRINDATTETYAVVKADGTHKGALTCTLVLNGRTYVYVYDFGTSKTSKGSAIGGTTGAEVSATGDWGAKTTTKP